MLYRNLTTKQRIARARAHTHIHLHSCTRRGDIKRKIISECAGDSDKRASKEFSVL